jgi:hypothetical protein
MGPLRAPHSPTAAKALLVQAVPAFILMPLLRVCTWVAYVWILVHLRTWVYTGVSLRPPARQGVSR